MSVRRLTLTGLVTLGVLGSGLVFSGAPAMAGFVTPYLSQLTGFNHPSGVTVDSSGNIYVADSEHATVDKFNSSGLETAFFGSAFYIAGSQLTGTEGGSFGAPQGVALDTNSEDLYVADSSKHAVDVFNSSSGVYQRELTQADGVTPYPFIEPWGITVDQSTGEVYVADAGEGVIDVFNSAGVFQSQFGSGTFSGGGAHSVAVNESTGEVYVGDFDRDVVYVFKGGVLQATWTGANTPQGTFGESGVLVAVDQSTGNVYIAVGESLAVDVFDDSGNYLTQIDGESTPNDRFLEMRGLSLDSKGNLYILNDAFQAVDIFGPTRFLATVTSLAPSNVQSTSATLNGTVNPEGVDANTIEFEYGTTTAYGSTVQATPTDAGKGSSEVSVSANVPNLTPNTLYHYRLDATNSNGTTDGPDETFKSVLVAPTVTDQPTSASNVTQSGATLNATINPGNTPTAYHFLYGPTSAYGSLAPIPDLYAPINDIDDSVSQDITGLTAGTTYHYALVASGAGGTVTGPDQTFTTPSIPAPAVSTGAASVITVGAATLSGAIDAQQWSTVYHFEYGTTTSYGSDWPTVDVSLGGLSNSQPVSVYVENLQPATTYHYRLVATNGGGTTYGPDMALTTAEYPPSVIQPAPVLTASLGFFEPEVRPSSSKSTAKTLTNAQKLTKALNACRAKRGKKRNSCEAAARKKYSLAKKQGKKK